MDKTEINAKLQCVFDTLPLSVSQKEIFSKVVITIIDNVVKEVKDNDYSKNTISNLELIKQADGVELLEENDDIATVISTVNTLINNLKAAGVVKK